MIAWLALAPLAIGIFVAAWRARTASHDALGTISLPAAGPNVEPGP
jgi:hypothetical protein